MPGPQPAAAAAPQATPQAILSPAEQVSLSHLLHRMSHDPRTRAMTAELVHAIDPNLARRAFSDVALEKRLAAFEKKLNDRDLQNQITDAVKAQQAQKAKLRGRYSDEQIGDIEKAMQAHGLHDYEVGAAVYDSQNPKRDPRDQVTEDMLAGGPTWSFPSPEGKDGKPIPFEDFKKDPNRATRSAAYRVIDEFKRKILPSQFAAA